MASESGFEAVRRYIGDHPSLAEACSLRKFRQLLWDVVGCEVSIGDWQQFTAEEQRLILYASFYGISTRSGSLSKGNWTDSGRV